MKDKINILSLEDSTEDFELIKYALTSDSLMYDITNVQTKKGYEEALNFGDYDIVIADYTLPAFDGKSALEILQAKKPDLPFIFCSGTIGEENAVKVMTLGAKDFVLKDNLFKLPHVIKRVLNEEEEKRKRKIADDQVLHLNRILRAIRQVNREIVYCREKTELIDSVCKILVEHNGYNFTFIALFDHCGKFIYCAQSGDVGSHDELISGLSRGRMPKCWNKVNEVGKVYCIDHMKSPCPDCPIKDDDQNSEFRSFTASLKYEDKFFGYITASVPTFFKNMEEEKILFQELAQDISYALSNFETRKEKALAVESLIYSESKFKHLFNDSSDFIFIHEAGGKILEANEIACQALHFEKQELLNMSIADLGLMIYSSLDGITLESIRQKKNIYVEDVISSRSGDLIPVELKIRSIEYEGVSAVLSIARDITSRKNVDEVIKNFEIKLNSITNSAHDGIIMVNPEGQIVFWNPAAESIFGYSAQEVDNKFVHNLIVPNYYKELHKIGISNLDLKTKNGSAGKTMELIGLRKDGSEVPIELTLTAVRINNKSNAIAIVRDITSRKESERALRESEEKFRILIENSIDPIILIDKLGVFNYFNKAATELFMYSENELSKISAWDLTPNGKSGIYEDLFNQVINNGKVFSEIEVRRRDGALVPIEVNAVLLPNGLICAISRDITERKKNETELRKYRDNLEDLIKVRTEALENSNRIIQSLVKAVEQSPSSVVMTDREAKITYVNKAFMEITGYSSEEVIGQNPNLLKSGFHDDEFYKHLWETILSGKVWMGDLRNKKKNGEEYWERSRIAPVLDENGEITAFVAIKEDTTREKFQEEELLKSFTITKNLNENLTRTLEELKLAQYHLVQSEKMAALGQLIAGIAHEINSPLGAIKSQNEHFIRDINKLMEKTPNFIKTLPEDILASISSILINSSHTSMQMSIKEEREARKALLKQIADMGIEISAPAIDLLTDIGIYDMIEEFRPILRHDRCLEILEVMKKIMQIKYGSLIISEATASIMKIVFALKNYVHFDHSGEFTEKDITETIDTVLTLYRNKMKYSVELIVDYEHHDPISCYPDQLTQVWTNILHNSLHAMEYQGKIEIRVYRDSDYVVASFKDSGIGIPDEIQDRIFEPFFTNKPPGEGTGLGLDIAKKIVEKHNGRITFDSQAGEGARFDVYLPVKGVKE